MSLFWNKESLTTNKKSWIIDYSFYIYNGSYAYKRPCPNSPSKWAKECIPGCKVCDGSARLYMQSKDGHVTGGLYAVLKQAIDRAKEGYNILTVFDPPKQQLDRMKLLDSYKGNRPDVPEWITFQMNWGETFLPYTGIECYYSDHDESDDVMATLARELSEDGHEVVVATDDKDLFPILGYDNVKIFRQKEIFDIPRYRKYLKKKNNVVIDDPSRFNEFLAICGDSADNFNLINGLGPKAAEYIINNYSSCMEIFDKFDTLPTKYQKKLVKHSKDPSEKCKNKKGCFGCDNFIGTLRDDMELSLKIATLVDNADYVNINKEKDEEKVKKMLQSLDLNYALNNLEYLI